MLKQRLLYGTLMTVVFTGLVVADGWFDGSTTASPEDDKAVQGTVVAILTAVVLALGCWELGALARAREFVIWNPVAALGAALLATAWFWPQFLPVDRALYLLFVGAAALAGIVLQQYVRRGTEGMLANCGVSCFAMVYLGLLGAFVPAIRIDAGLWGLLATIVAVKFSDIGAYTLGKALGRHKLAPRISPGKTWEGLAGAVVAAMVVTSAFAAAFGIMSLWLAPVFGVCIAVIGQLSDLVESMLKRDAGQKDSSNRVPGFGGILDVIDSPLFAAPFAYAFFRLLA
jgi:phosphatidate cytidylyltransferase